MVQLTLEGAQKIVYKELGILFGTPCKQGEAIYPQTYNDVAIKHTYCADCHFDYTDHEYEALGAHDIPMPPLDDGLLAVILRRLIEARFIVTFDGDECDLFNPRTEQEIVVNDGDPLAATVMAFAQYLQSKGDR